MNEDLHQLTDEQLRAEMLSNYGTESQSTANRGRGPARDADFSRYALATLLLSERRAARQVTP
jgi:hypothetical protein